MAVIQRIKLSWPLRYRGSLIVLVLCLFIWPPLLVTLAIKNAFIHKDGHLYYCDYQGSWFWIFFWAILFFPIAFLLFFIKGLDIIEETQETVC